MKISKLALAVLFVPMLVMGAYQTEAASAGSIEGGNIYTATRNGSEATFTLRITNTGSTTMHSITVHADKPIEGDSTVTVCAANATPQCTSDDASVSGSNWHYVSGSTTGGTGGDIFGSKRLSVGDLAAGSDHTVSFRMHQPAVRAGSGGSGNGSSNQSTQPAQSTTSNTPTPTHNAAAVSQPNQSQSNEGSNNETLPTVSVAAPDVNADQSSNTATENQANQPATTDNGDNLATSGSAAGAGALALGLVIGGALYLQRSRSALTAALLNKN